MKRLCLGKIVAAHGVKGLVKILPFGDDPALLESLSPLFTSESGDETLTIELKNPIGRYWLAVIEGVNDRTQAENLVGTELFTTRDKLPAIQETNTYYHDDLIGLSVVNEAGETIGTVANVQNFGAGDLLNIRKKSGGSFLLPFSRAYTGLPDFNQRILRVTQYEEFMDL